VRSGALGIGVAALFAGACGAQTWSFDRILEDTPSIDGDAAADAPADSPADTSAPAAGDDTDAEHRAKEAGPAPEAGPSLEASSACKSDDDCSFLAPVCQPSGDCAPCSQDLDCAGAAGGPACDTATGACVPCTSSLNCAGQAGVTHCDTTAHTCVACLASTDCPRESICELASHTCTPSL
jgi:hypothetical protein